MRLQDDGQLQTPPVMPGHLVPDDRLESLMVNDSMSAWQTLGHLVQRQSASIEHHRNPQVLFRNLSEMAL